MQSLIIFNTYVLYADSPQNIMLFMKLWGRAITVVLAKQGYNHLMRETAMKASNTQK